MFYHLETITDILVMARNSLNKHERSCASRINHSVLWWKMILHGQIEIDTKFYVIVAILQSACINLLNLAVSTSST